MKIINLTPHDIVYQNEEGEQEVFKASGKVARVEQFLFDIGGGGKYNLKSSVTGCVEGIPAESNDTVYIVSNMVREELKDREDLWSPTSFIRDDEGRIVACTAFICW